MRPLVCLAVAAALFPLEGTLAQEPAVAVFKSAVERVALAAIVRDSRGRIVNGLEARDFER